MENPIDQGELFPAAAVSTNANGLKAVELADLLKVGRSTITENVKKELDNPGHFRQWSQTRDPGGVAWTFSGDGNNRRFYRCAAASVVVVS